MILCRSGRMQRLQLFVARQASVKRRQEQVVPVGKIIQPMLGPPNFLNAGQKTSTSPASAPSPPRTSLIAAAMRSGKVSRRDCGRHSHTKYRPKGPPLRPHDRAVVQKLVRHRLSFERGGHDHQIADRREPFA